MGGDGGDDDDDDSSSSFQCQLDGNNTIIVIGFIASLCSGLKCDISLWEQTVNYRMFGKIIRFSFLFLFVQTKQRSGQQQSHHEEQIQAHIQKTGKIQKNRGKKPTAQLKQPVK